MKTWRIFSAALVLGVGLWSGTALGQGKPAACAGAPEKVEGQVVKVELDQGKVTVRENDGTIHEFQADKETLQGYKAGDHIQAKLRSAPNCK